MEVRSDPGKFPFRESFSPGFPTSPARDPPTIQSMRLPYTRDGPSPSPTPLVVAAPFQGGGSASSAAAERPSLAALRGLSINIEEPVKRKRGRPRKHGPDGTMSLALSPTFAAGSTTLGRFSPSTNSASDPTKKAKGRPPGTGKKQQMAALGSAGIGFTPHVIVVNAGEDVSSKIMSFSQHGPRSVCILSANGAISNVSLRQAATSGGTVTYEGRFEILSLSGSFLLSESSGHRSRTGGLSVCLAGPDGLLLGGGVAGVLTAASPVQVVVGCFVVDEKMEPKQINPSDLPASTLMKLTPIRPIGTTGATSSPSRGALSESSSSGSRSPLIHNTGVLDNNHQGLSNLLWK